MAAAIDTGNVVSFSNFFGGSASFNVTCAGSDNFLVVLIETFGSPTPVTAVTYNSVALTQLSLYEQPTGFGPALQLYYLASPTTGSALSLSVTNTASACYATAIPFSGVNTSAPFGTVGPAFSTSNNNPAVTPTGGTSNDVYICQAINGVATSTVAGANQTSLSALTVNGNTSFVTSYIPGVDTGAFSWTGSGTSDGAFWSAQGVAVKGVSGPAPQPFVSNPWYGPLLAQ
jgi:hypothetical protein